ncbi:MAG: (2Fe-2S)-binding protein [Gammaproteobacteria bacterium]|jgi:aerobic carbon-monoxide dehydrogenase small subunit|nr:(2Fe-2S)-binding protein [Gammaproteobacteria bacterium]
MSNKTDISVNVNGREYTRHVSPRVSLADFIRHDLGLTGTHVGCEHGVCGACVVKLDGKIVRSCLTLAVQTDGHAIETIEGLSESGEISDMQEIFHKRNALQCGYCTPGILLTAAELLEKTATPDREEIREFLSGNLCRCTGYEAIIDAVEETARERQDGK